MAVYTGAPFTLEAAHACIQSCRDAVPDRAYRPAAYASCLDSCSGLPPTQGYSPEDVLWFDRVMIETGQVIESSASAVGAVAERYIPWIAAGLIALAVLSLRR